MSAINLRAEEQSCACQNIAVVIRFIIAGISDPDILVCSARWYFAQFFICVLLNFSVSSTLQQAFFGLGCTKRGLRIFKHIPFSRSNAFGQ